MNRRTPFVRLSSLVVLMFCCCPGRAQPCTTGWIPEFPDNNVLGTINALAVFDDGSGPTLYAGGSFALSGGDPPANIAKWTAEGWTAPVPGLNGTVHALAVFTDDQGTALYAGGEFTVPSASRPALNLARWSGTAWEGCGIVDNTVRSLTVCDTGTGPALFAGGDFNHAGGVASGHVARLSAAGDWSALSSGCNAPVLALTAHNPGAGVSLYAGGLFTSAGGQACDHLSRWNGSSWTPVGGGMLSGSGPDIVVRALGSYDDGTGPALYVGGSFRIPRPFGEPAMLNVARWRGAWEPLGQSLEVGSTFGLGVTSLGFLQTPQGPRIYAGSDLYQHPSNPAPIVSVMEFNGVSWSNMGGGIGNGGLVKAIAAADLGDGPRVVVGGNFTRAGPLSVEAVATWRNGSWEPLGRGVGGTVRTLLHDPEGLPPGVYVGGEFQNAAGVVSPCVARWDGQWHALGQGFPGTNSTVYTLCAFDDGSGPALYAGGVFAASGPTALQNVARWNGAAWTGVGTGTNGPVYRLLPFYDGATRLLLACGSFTMAGGVPSVHLARWDGTAWWPIATQMSGSVLTMAAYAPPGMAPSVYMGGPFTSINSMSFPGFARWSPSTGFHGVPGPFFPVGAICTGNVRAPRLFVGGGSTALAEGYLGAWDGQAWAFTTVPDPVEELAVITAPAESRLVFKGSRFVGGTRVSSVRLWDGAEYSGTAHIDDDTVQALCQAPDGGVLVGGSFRRAEGVSSGGLAHLRICPTCYANCDQSTVPPVLNVLDFTCFLNQFAAGGAAANCDGSLVPPVLNVLDFGCFLNRFAAGCP
jgi:hypothetical protein